MEIFNKYTNERLDIEMPNARKYDFLLERNKNYMNNIALSFGKKKITYEEMHTRIEEYARALYKRGVRKGDVIGVCVANTPEAVYLLYALDIIGAVVVGLSPLENEYQMRRDLEMVKPKMVITVDKLYGNFKSSEEALNFSSILYSPVESMNALVKLIYGRQQAKAGNKILGVDHNLSQIVKKYGKSNYVKAPYVEGEVTDIMFTGGSSGVHKGVDLSGNGLNCVVRGMEFTFPDAEPGKIHLGNIPLGHMSFGRMIMHYSLCTNLEYALTLNALPKDFYQTLIDTKCNYAVGGPVHWETLIDNPKVKKGSLINLEHATSGGEAFQEEKKKKAQEALIYGGSKASIGDGLGATETWATICANNGNNTFGTLGYIIPLVDSKIVDSSTGLEVEKGKCGLLHLSGPSIMNGYHNNEEETKKVLYQDEAGKTWFNMGDIVKENEKGEIVYVGRVKRNFVCDIDNIYPEEIEEIILEIPEIREAAVTKIPDDRYQYLPKYHISLYTDEINFDDLEQRVNDLISSRLGINALPGYIEYTTSPLPRTGNTKIDFTLLQTQDDELFKAKSLTRKLK